MWRRPALLQWALQCSKGSLHISLRPNQPESPGINRICQNVSTVSTLKWPADRPCANEDPASSDCLAWHLTEICDNEVQVRQQFLLGQSVYSQLTLNFCQIQNTCFKKMQGASCFSCVGWQLLALPHPIASKPRLGLSLGRHSLTSGAYSEHEGHNKYLIDYYSYYLNASVSHCSKWAMSQIIN
jgi:hypothetical protein